LKKLEWEFKDMHDEKKWKVTDERTKEREVKNPVGEEERSCGPDDGSEQISITAAEEDNRLRRVE
jgi:hypothetical protein